MPEPTGINLDPYHQAVATLREQGVEIRERYENGALVMVSMPDSRGVMRQTNILAIIERYRELG